MITVFMTRKSILLYAFFTELKPNFRLTHKQSFVDVFVASKRLKYRGRWHILIRTIDKKPYYAMQISIVKNWILCILQSKKSLCHIHIQYNVKDCVSFIFIEFLIKFGNSVTSIRTYLGIDRLHLKKKIVNWIPIPNKLIKWKIFRHGFASSRNFIWFLNV